MGDIEAAWEAHYGAAERIWSGRANATLVGEVARLEPGTALDVGCGEGADAIWLATHGWRVTATDVSLTALSRGASAAAEAGVAHRIDWQQHELTSSFPAGAYDLVSVQFFHSWEGPPRDPVLRSAASAVSPGGLLLIVSHAEPPPWAEGHHHERMEAPDETLAALRLDDRWGLERVGVVERSVTAPDGSPATLVDGVVRVRRHS